MGLPRFHIEGHVYYITTNIYNRLPIFVRPSFVVPLYDSLNYYRYKLQFRILGYVFMPDHIHLLLWPLGESTISDVMKYFKEFTSKRIIRQTEVENRTDWLQAFRHAGEETHRSDRKVWQDSYWDVNVYREDFLREKLTYLHANPVRAGLVASPADYAYSSYRNYYLGDEWLIEVDKDWL